jgi:hypothetical protein
MTEVESVAITSTDPQNGSSRPELNAVTCRDDGLAAAVIDIAVGRGRSTTAGAVEQRVPPIALHSPDRHRSPAVSGSGGGQSSLAHECCHIRKDRTLLEPNDEPADRRKWRTAGGVNQPAAAPWT